MLLLHTYRDAMRADSKPCLKEHCLDLLQQLKPSPRHSLAGLDEITANGINGFTVLEKVVNFYLKDKNFVGLFEKTLFKNIAPI